MKKVLLAIVLITALSAPAMAQQQKPTIEDNINAFLIGVDTGMHGAISTMGRFLYSLFS